MQHVRGGIHSVQVRTRGHQLVTLHRPPHKRHRINYEEIIIKDHFFVNMFFFKSSHSSLSYPSFFQSIKYKVQGFGKPCNNKPALSEDPREGDLRK